MEQTQAISRDSVPYQRPALGVAGLRFLLAIRPLLPFAIYRALYDFSFGSYRRLLRQNYRLKALGGNAETRKRNRVVYESMPYSLVGWRGLEATYDAVVAANREQLPGVIVECGVAQGGSALLLARLATTETPSREIWLFDSYEGLPEATKDDYIGGVTGRHVRPLPKGSCLGTIEQVSTLLFETFKLPRKPIHLVKGWFQDTLPVTRQRLGTIAVLRLDGDWYESTKCCFENLYDQVAPGGFVILDDYHSCFGCQKATDEFMRARGLKAAVVPDGRGGAFFRKPRNGG